MSYKAYKEIQYMPHPLTCETKQNQAMFLITAIIFQYSLTSAEPCLGGGHLLGKPHHLFSFYSYLTFQVSISMCFVFPLTASA